MPEVETAPKPVKAQPKPKSSTEAQKPLKRDVTAQIERLTLDGKASQAMDIALKSIEDGVYPKANVLKFVLRNLAEQGNVEKIQALGKLFDSSFSI